MQGNQSFKLFFFKCSFYSCRQLDIQREYSFFILDRTQEKNDSYDQHPLPPLVMFFQWEQKWQPFTLNITACTCGEGPWQLWKQSWPCTGSCRAERPQTMLCRYGSCSQTFPGRPARAVEKHHCPLPSWNPLPFTSTQKNVSDALKSQN